MHQYSIKSTAANAVIRHGDTASREDGADGYCNIACCVSSTFTAYIRSLGPAGEPPSAESFGTLLGTLRGALVHEMKRRSVWSAPPSFLGVYGGRHWADSDVLEELLLGCYQYIFILRLAALRRQLEVRSNLDGLIFLNIRHFLHEAQRRNDPLGMRLFEITHGAVEQLVRAGTLHLLDGDPRIRNATVLAFAAWRDPQEARGVDLGGPIAAWCDALLPDLVSAWGKEEMTERLAERIAALPTDGIDAFRFRDLLGPLKAEVRARWRALAVDGETAIAGTGEEQLEPTRLVPPDTGFEESQSFAELRRCVSERLDAVEERAKTREYLRRLWFCLWLWAAEAKADSTAAEEEDLPATAAEALATAGRLPSDKRLGELLSIPRARISGLKETLGRLLEDCQGTTAGAVGGPRPPMTAGQRRQGLRRATGDAAATASAATTALGDRAGEPPRPGEIFLFRGAQTLPVEWLAVEEDTRRGRLWLAPVDQAPFVGSGDLSIQRGGGEAGQVRCRLGGWFDAARLAAEVRTGELPADELARVRRQRERILRGELDSSTAARQVDRDPEYRHWIAELEAARAELVEDTAEVVPFEPQRRVPFRWRALAAAFAAVALGLGLWSFSLRRQLDRWSQPVLVARSATQIVRFEAQRELEVQVSPAARHLGFRVPLTRYASYDAVRLRWLDPAGEEVLWSSDWVSGESELFLVLPRQRLTAAVYLLRLDGRRLDGTEVEIDETTVELEPAD